MRNFDAETLAYLNGGDIHAHLLIWMKAKNRDTGVTESIGFWTGDDHQSFAVSGATRLYYGAGNIIQVPAFSYEVGLGVRIHTLSMSAISDEVAQAIRAYEPRLAPVEIHRVFFDLANGGIVAPPHRVFRGWCDSVSITRPEIGGSATCEVSVASAARALTKSVAQLKSDETQKLRSGDRFRRYSAVAGTIEVLWGEKGGKS